MKKFVIASVMLLGLTAPSMTLAAGNQPVYNTQELYQSAPPRPVPVQRPVVAPMGPGPGVLPAYPYGPWGGPYLPCVPTSGCGYY